MRKIFIIIDIMLVILIFIGCYFCVPNGKELELAMIHYDVYLPKWVITSLLISIVVNALIYYIYIKVSENLYEK